jgi:mannosyltransferase OCH1-like enzyme
MNKKGKQKIPKIVHQIWIGGSSPFKLHQLYMDTCNKLYKEWEYLLWTNDDINRVNFPKTYDYIEKIIERN